MYCSIYTDKTYGDNWSLLVYTFTTTGGGLVGGSAPFAIIVDSSMVGGIFWGRFNAFHSSNRSTITR